MTELYEATVIKSIDNVVEVVETRAFTDIDKVNNFCTKFNTSGRGWDSPNHFMRASWKKIT